MKCPVCGGAELIPDTRDLPYTYKGETTTIPAVTGEFYPACGEVILDRYHGDRYSTLLGQFHRKVNTVFVDPEYIARVRKKFDLGQREAAEIFGVVPMPSRVMKMARPSRRWRWYNYLSCSRITPTYQNAPQCSPITAQRFRGW